MTANFSSNKDGYLYDYDGENRIVKISRGDGDATPTTVAEFVYDALGRRIYAYDNIAQTSRYFCYNNTWQVLEEYDDAGDFAWANVFGNYIDEVLVRSATSSKYYYAHNHLYSPVAVMDGTAGTVLERYDYDAYGTTHIMDASYTARTAGAVGNPYTFTGRELDTLDGGNLKTMHYRHRSYDPFTGRFGQQDPYRIVPNKSSFNPQNQYRHDGILLYIYAYNPIVYVDPHGLYGGGSSSICEKVKQVCSVGPIDAWKARQLAREAVEKAKGAFPGQTGHNDQQDAFRHCYWSCRMAQEINAGQAEDVGNIHENCNNGPEGETVMDKHNNAVGRSIATGGGDCYSDCWEDVFNGRLQTSPGGQLSYQGPGDYYDNYDYYGGSIAVQDKLIVHTLSA